MTPGTVTAKIFVARTAIDFASCPSGAILLIRWATPNVVMAFGKAAAIVSEVGGVTCHAAILAREYGIPCAVGVSGVFDEDLNELEGVLYASDGILEVTSDRQ